MASNITYAGSKQSQAPHKLAGFAGIDSLQGRVCALITCSGLDCRLSVDIFFKTSCSRMFGIQEEEKPQAVVRIGVATLFLSAGMIKDLLSPQNWVAPAEMHSDMTPLHPAHSWLVSTIIDQLEALISGSRCNERVSLSYVKMQ